MPQADGFARLFTQQEANVLLGELRPLVESVILSRDRILQLKPGLESTIEKALGNGGGQFAGEALVLFERIRRAVDAIRARGVLIKDLGQGLLDFPAEREGEVVYLCWKFGEPSVDYWHPLDGGFAKRQPI